MIFFSIVLIKHTLKTSTMGNHENDYFAQKHVWHHFSKQPSLFTHTRMTKHNTFINVKLNPYQEHHQHGTLSHQTSWWNRRSHPNHRCHQHCRHHPLHSTPSSSWRPWGKGTPWLLLWNIGKLEKHPFFFLLLSVCLVVRVVHCSRTST